MVECLFTNSVVLSSSPVAEMLIAGGNRMHQSKSWYYIGPSQTSKVECFCGNCFRLLAVNFFCKKLQLRMFDKFHKTLPKTLFHVLLVKILHLEKKKEQYLHRRLKFTFPIEDVID